MSARRGEGAKRHPEGTDDSSDSTELAELPGNLLQGMPEREPRL